ncbi:MAG: F0F1 ATP synthase subunit A [Aggregatilineales bacterium]
MRNRLTNILITALVVTVISLAVVFVLAIVTGSSVSGDTFTLGNALLGDTLIVLVALWVVYVVAARRPIAIVPDRLQGGLEVGVEAVNGVAVATSSTPQRRQRRNWGLIGLVVVIVWFVFFEVIAPALHFGVGLPVISVPGEPIAGTAITNTMVGTFIADVVVILLVLFVTSRLKQVPSRLQSVFEFMIEAFDGFANQMAGNAARSILPLALTIFLFLLVANWLELVPFVDSLGLANCAEVGQAGYGAYTGIAGIRFLDVNKPLDSGSQVSAAEFASCKQDYGQPLTDEEKAIVNAPGFKPVTPHLYVINSLVRAAATDLNLTVMLALLAFVVVEAYGVRAHGRRYFFKFINVPAARKMVAKGTKPGRRAFLGIDVFVGILEGVSEIARILSFSFRLFGNIFAGQALLFVIPFLVAAILPLVVYGLETFVGFIQAFVFALLVLMFTGIAVEEAHGNEDIAHEGAVH